MNPEDVTLVTRNDRYPEWRLLLDALGWVGIVYLWTHPDAFDTMCETAGRYWTRFVHTVSVWAARQDIRSLPETEE